MTGRRATGRGTPALAALAIGVVYWFAAGRLSDVAEPWDASGFWSIAYPGALLLAGLLGLAWPRHGWAWGAIVVLAQVIVVIATGGAGPLIAVGIVYAAVLALPAMLVAQVAGRIRARAGGATRDAR